METTKDGFSSVISRWIVVKVQVLRKSGHMYVEKHFFKNASKSSLKTICFSKNANTYAYPLENFKMNVQENRLFLRRKAKSCPKRQTHPTSFLWNFNIVGVKVLCKMAHFTLKEHDFQKSEQINDFLPKFQKFSANFTARLKRPYENKF